MAKKKINGKELVIQLGGQSHSLPMLALDDDTQVSREYGSLTRSGTLSINDLIPNNDFELKSFFEPVSTQEAGLEFGGNVSLSGTGIITSFTDTTPKRKASYKRLKRNNRRVLKINLSARPFRSYSATMKVLSLN